MALQKTKQYTIGATSALLACSTNKEERQCAAEEWRPVVGYEGSYEVSNFGNVRSIPRYREVLFPNGKIVKILFKGKTMSPSRDKRGYYSICLRTPSDDGITFKVHRLVAMAFIQNQNNYQCINHKDENKSNNHADNLEWCTHKYNNSYGKFTEILKEIYRKKSHIISQYTKNGEFIKTYPSVSEAARVTGVSKRSILRYLHGEHICYKYDWRYENRKDNI